jgi:preprotein translocase subunit YajC
VTAADLIFKAIFWKAMFFGIIIPTVAFSCYWYLLYRQQQAFIKKLEEILDK